MKRSNPFSLVRIRLTVRNCRRFLIFRMKGLLLTGLFVVVPFFIALWMAWWIYDWLTVWAIGLASSLDLPGINGENSSFWVQQGIRLLSLIFILVMLIVVGQLARMTLGRRMISMTQRMLLHLPIVNFIYSTCKQIGDAVRSSSGGMFHQVVLFEYPNPGCYALGFLTNENNDEFEVTRKLGKPVVSIFMPTTPNPTSGFLLMIPRERCIFLDMSVSEAMRLIVSVGTVLPGQLPEKKPE